MNLKKNLLWLPLLSILMISSCNKEEYGQDNPNTKDSFIFDVEWTPSTTYFDENALSDLLRVDTNDYRYYFSENSSLAGGLSEGDVLVIHGLALRKVESILHQGNEIIVETGYATLNEAIDNGDIEWNYGVGFNEPLTPELLVEGESHPFKKSADDSFSVSLKIGDFDYKISMKFNGDHAEVTQEIEKKVADMTRVRFVCEGVIDQFRTSNKISYKDSEVSYYENDNDGLKGELTVSLTAAGSGNDLINFEFPVTLLKFPFMVGPIPVILNVKVMFVSQAVVPPEGSSLISVKFTYDSSTGIKYEPAKGILANGDQGKYKIEKDQAQTGAASAIAINFGLGFPRLEVGLFGEVIVPWVHTAFLIGGDYTFHPACQQAKAAYIGACGYKLGFLGLSFEGTKTLWNIEEILLQSGDCDGQPAGFNSTLLTTNPDETGNLKVY